MSTKTYNSFSHNPFLTHPVMRGLLTFSIIIAILSALTIVNSNARYDSMPPLDFVLATLTPLLLFTVREHFSIRDMEPEYHCQRTIKIAWIPLWKNAFKFSGVVSNRSTKHPQLEWYQGDKRILATKVKTNARVADLTGRVSADLLLANSPSTAQEGQ